MTTSAANDANRDAIVRMEAEVHTALDKLRKIFKPEVRLSFIARLPGYDEADVLITMDDPEGIRGLIDRRAPAKIQPTAPVEVSEAMVEAACAAYRDQQDPITGDADFEPCIRAALTAALECQRGGA